MRSAGLRKLWQESGTARSAVPISSNLLPQEQPKRHRWRFSLLTETILRSSPIRPWAKRKTNKEDRRKYKRVRPPPPQENSKRRSSVFGQRTEATCRARLDRIAEIASAHRRPRSTGRIGRVSRQQNGRPNPDVRSIAIRRHHRRRRTGRTQRCPRPRSMLSKSASRRCRQSQKHPFAWHPRIHLRARGVRPTELLAMAREQIANPTAFSSAKAR